MRRGFNLLEVGITLVVLAIIAVLAVPTYSRYQQRQQLRMVADALAHDVMAAREAAIVQRRPAFLRLQGGTTDWCWGVSVAAPCDCRNAVRACRIAVHDGQDHRNVVVPRGGLVQWSPIQGAAEPAEPLELTTPSGESLSVKVNAQGRPSVCGPSARIPGPC